MAWINRHFNLVIAVMASFPSAMLIQSGLENSDQVLVGAGVATSLICLVLVGESFAQAIRRFALKALLGEKGKAFVDMMDQFEKVQPTMLTGATPHSTGTSRLQFSVNSGVQFDEPQMAAAETKIHAEEPVRETTQDLMPQSIEFCLYRNSDQYSGYSDLQSLEVLSQEMPATIGKRLVLAGFRSATNKEQTLQYCLENQIDAKSLICAEIMPDMDLISHSQIEFSGEVSKQVIQLLEGLKRDYSQVVVFLPQSCRAQWQTVALRINSVRSSSDVIIEDLYQG